jgi:hypothetical protein
MEPVELTVRWMSGDVTTVVVDGRWGWWQAKQAVLAARALEISPYHLRLMRPEGDDWVEARGIVIGGAYDAVVLTPKEEHAEFIYACPDATLWRLEWRRDGYRQVELVMSRYGEKGYATQWEYHQAKKANEVIPWRSIESLLERRSLSEDVTANLLQLVEEKGI